MSPTPMLLARPMSVHSLFSPVLCVTEGVFDIACLTRLSQIVRTVEPDLPDLQELTAQGRMILIPAGGGDLAAWTHRLAPLICPQYYLFDREQMPETALRQSVVDQINERPYCRAVLTRKRSLENYLHPTAIAAASGIWVEITDDTPVAEAVAQARPAWQAVWPTLTHRARQRQIYRTKRLLNTEAVRHMTADLLAERDPAGEVIGWFRDIGRLVSDSRP